MSKWKISLSDLNYDGEEARAVARVIESRWLTMGEQVEAFEKEFAEFIGTKHAVAVANGTAALHLAYCALDFKPGDEIIQPGINFVAAANMTIACGARPVFAEIVALDEPTIDPAEVEKLITPATKAVVVMHYGGYPCRMEEIQAVCRKHNIAIVEDACHAVGAKNVGRMSTVACFSFFSNKNLAVGEGGMVTTDDDELAQKVRRLRSHGMTTLTWDRHRGHASSYDVAVHGYNYRLDEIRAALGREQLKKLDRGNAKRKELVAAYRRQLAGWTVPFRDYEGSSAYHLMVALAPSAEKRAELLNRLTEARIQYSMHYPCIPDFSAFSACRERELAMSREFAARAITLPLYPGLTEEQVREICQVLMAADIR